MEENEWNGKSNVMSAMSAMSGNSDAAINLSTAPLKLQKHANKNGLYAYIESLIKDGSDTLDDSDMRSFRQIIQSIDRKVNPKTIDPKSDLHKFIIPKGATIIWACIKLNNNSRIRWLIKEGFQPSEVDRAFAAKMYAAEKLSKSVNDIIQANMVGEWPESLKKLLQPANATWFNDSDQLPFPRKLPVLHNVRGLDGPIGTSFQLNGKKPVLQRGPEVPFVPSNAFVIMGHSSEMYRSFPVPANCVVIIKAQSADYTFGRDTLLRACSLNPKILKDPITYSSELIEAIGDVAIYKPGDMCPNFNFELIPGNADPDGDHKADNANGMYYENFDDTVGITDIIRYCPSRSTTGKIMPPKQFDKKSIINFIGSSYKTSLQPTHAEIMKSLSEIPHPTNDTPYPKPTTDVVPAFYTTVLPKNRPRKVINYYLDKLPENLINISMKDIWIGAPGVYYNFACRFLSDVSDRITKTELREGNQKTVLTAPTNMPFGSRTNAIGHTLLRRIGQGRSQRVPYIRKAYEAQRARATTHKRAKTASGFTALMGLNKPTTEPNGVWNKGASGWTRRKNQVAPGPTAGTKRRRSSSR